MAGTPSNMLIQGRWEHLPGREVVQTPTTVRSKTYISGHHVPLRQTEHGSTSNGPRDCCTRPRVERCFQIVMR